MLYIIPTPIGNREDITLRALRLFKELEIFICEDTRTFKKLLSMYEIEYSNKEFYSLTSFTDKGKLNFYLNLLKSKDVGLVSEAGTPGLSDPGKSLIQLCNENDIIYTVLPGANALVPSVVSASFDTSNFIFLGFLAQKKGRQTALKTAIQNDVPSFFYESVHRFEKLLFELKDLGFSGKIFVAREISKMYEQIFNGNLDEIIDLVKNKKLPIKGEFVIGLY
ncbi:MAG TPA: 16S rRNA (cytidine(1402)-2'-O)-methyltransferase, partial [Candidatus Absconditabacterales bacterium]|nr:16S rRNA (cytidine(1402)-2'-O)-methyltransferase [Candidatus Absconditabacterales bacterium]